MECPGSLEDVLVVVLPAEVSPMMVRVRPWAVKAPAIASRTALVRSLRASRGAMAGEEGVQKRV
jgi:hypothetical protein